MWRWTMGGAYLGSDGTAPEVMSESSSQRLYAATLTADSAAAGAVTAERSSSSARPLT